MRVAKLRIRLIVICIVFTILTFLFLRLVGFDQKVFYVISEEELIGSLPQDLASVAEENGLASSLGSATDERGNTLYAIEATSPWMHLWGQNMPLSGKENPKKCGVNPGPRPDPRQFVVSVKARLPFSPDRVTELAKRIEEGLEEKGYYIARKPLDCGQMYHKGK